MAGVWGPHLGIHRLCQLKRKLKTTRLPPQLLFFFENDGGVLGDRKTPARSPPRYQNLQIPTWWCQHSHMTLSAHLLPMETNWRDSGPFRIIWIHLVMFGSILNRRDQFLIMRNHLKSVLAIRCLYCPFGTILSIWVIWKGRTRGALGVH